jgi:hypothetical protein
MCAGAHAQPSAHPSRCLAPLPTRPTLSPLFPHDARSSHLAHVVFLSPKIVVRRRPRRTHAVRLCPPMVIPSHSSPSPSPGVARPRQCGSSAWPASATCRQQPDRPARARAQACPHFPVQPRPLCPRHCAIRRARSCAFNLRHGRALLASPRRRPPSSLEPAAAVSTGKLCHRLVMCAVASGPLCAPSFLLRVVYGPSRVPRPCRCWPWLQLALTRCAHPRLR